jgi:hypothetical protein
MTLCGKMKLQKSPFGLCISLEAQGSKSQLVGS